jgi:ubiquinone biosynthesis protein UbiJ
MNPFEQLKNLAYKAEEMVFAFTPPEWLVHEGQQKIVLFLNHVLKQELAATERLKRQRGKSVEFRWRQVVLRLCFTPAGLVERVDPASGVADLVLNINERSALTLFEVLGSGEKPSIRIEGDVQLAAEVNWLIDHVSWDVESDLSRLIGAESARFVVLVGQESAKALKGFAGAVKQGLDSFRERAGMTSASVAGVKTP